MKRNLKILILEDVESDIFLIQNQFKKTDFDCEFENVKSKSEFISSLMNFIPDIILSDYHLPLFSGTDALEISKIYAPDTPFIFVTGVLDEKTSVKLLKKGATDYVLKDNFIRLIPAVENALIIKEKNEQVKKTQNYLEQSRAKYLELYENAPDMFLTYNFKTDIIIECNQTLLKKTGYQKNEIVGHSICNFYPEYCSLGLKNKLTTKKFIENELENRKIRIVKKNGDSLYGNVNGKIDYKPNGSISEIHLAIRDISEIRKKEIELEETENRFKQIFDKSTDYILIFDLKENSIPILKEANNAAEEFLGNFNTEFMNKPLTIFIPHISEKEIINIVNQINKGQTVRKKIAINLLNSEVKHFDTIASLIYIKNIKYILVTARNITEQHLFELKIQKQNEKFKTLNKKYQKQNKDLQNTILKLNSSQKELSEKIDIINRSPVVSFSWENKEGWPVNYVSENVVQIFGYTYDEFINGNVLYEELIHPEDLLRVINEVEEGSKEKTNRKITHKSYRIITKNGKIKWVQDDTIIVRENDKILHYEGIISDITQEIEYRQALRNSEKKYRTMMDANPDIVVIVSKDREIQYMNPAAIKKFGFIKKGSSCHEKIFGSEEICYWCSINDVEEGKIIQKEIIAPDELKPYLITFSRIKGDGEDPSFLVSYKDVSELRKLQNERLQFLNILESGLNEVYLLNFSDFSISYLNTSAVDSLLYSKEELKKMKLYDFQLNETKDTYKKYLDVLKKGQEREINFETYQIRKDGTMYPVSVNLKLIKQSSHENILVFVNDISEKKERDETIRLLSAAIIESPVTIVITDVEGKIIFVNPNFTKLTGYPESEVLGKNPRVLKSGYQSDEFYDEMWKTISSGNAWKGEFHNKKKNGDLFWENVRIIPVKNKKGKITHYVAVKEDITEQKNIKKKLVESEQHFRLLFENSLIGMYLTTETGKILKANKTLINMLGFRSFEELRKLNLENKKQLEFDRKKFKSEINKKGFVLGFESVWSVKNQNTIYVRENARKYKNEKGSVFYEGTVENISDVVSAQEKLKEIHEFNKHIIRVGNLAYGIFDIEGNCISANKTYAEIMGTDVPELLKRNFNDDENWKEFRIMELAENCIKFGKNYKQIIQYKLNSKNNLWLELNLSRIYNGLTPQLLLIIKDISSYIIAKRRQVQTKSEYVNLIESVNVPIFGINLDGKINEWNTAIENLSGYNRQEIKTKKFKDVFGIEHNAVFHEFINNAFQGSAFSNEELDIVNKKGQIIRLLLSSTLKINDDDTVYGILCVAQDITKRERYKAELEKQIEERTHKLIEALKKEKELSTLKSQFVSMTSHEFRTPLSAIKFAAGFIRKYYNKADESKLKSKAVKIESQVNHMTNLLEDILTYGKVESGKMKFEPVELNLTKILQTIADDVFIASEKTHIINFVYDCSECMIISDDKIIRNIFINLLTNAIKFSPDSNEILLTLKTGTNNITIEVEDHGIGIKTEELATIFTPFRRGRNVETIQGTGLGLAIVKESVDLIKGKISVDSIYGKGSKFTVVIPLIRKSFLN